MLFLQLIVFLAGFLRLGITTVKTNPDPIAGVEQAGAMVPNGALLAAMAAVQQNAAPAFGNWSLTIVPSSLGARTYTGSELVGGIFRRHSVGGVALTDCTDTATNIVNAIPGAKINQSFAVLLANLNSSSPGLTLAGGTGVSMAGTNIVGGLQMRLFLGQVTGSAAVTLTGCFAMQLGSGL